jgi:hypothetical protein
MLQSKGINKISELKNGSSHAWACMARTRFYFKFFEMFFISALGNHFSGVKVKVYTFEAEEINHLWIQRFLSCAHMLIKTF